MIVFCFCSLDAGNWIDILGILVNAILGVWIVIAVQKNQTNRRTLKDHFIGEIKEIQAEYRIFLRDLDDGVVEVKTVNSWFKTMNIKVTGLMDHLNSEYEIAKDSLKPFQEDLRDLTTDSPEYTSLFQTGGRLNFGQATKRLYTQFQQDHLMKFNDIVRKINNA